MDLMALGQRAVRIDEREVRVHVLDLNDPWIDEEAVDAVLSTEELDRAGRFVVEAARTRFRAARAALRLLLAPELGVEPADVGFEVSSTGKPFLAAHNGPTIEFNVSHAGSLALIAVTLRRRVGIDIEIERAMPDAMSIVDRFFAPPERAAFHELESASRHRSFFSVWTRKEAFAKATGRGIADSLHRFAVPVDPDLPPRVEFLDWPEDETHQWRIVDLPVPTGYSSALAVEGLDWHLSIEAWPPAGH